ncbi:MAG: hypothetical protein AAF805_06410 [Planctomycetota bacterium]
MSKQRKPPKPTRPETGTDAPAVGYPGLWTRVAIGVAVVWHLFAVFIAPFSVPPTSPLVEGIATSAAVRWYTDPLYLNHGYHFFGPDPPINQLVRYRVTDSGGALIAEGEFPNKEQQSPRLFYHRHMMLADQAGLGPADVEPEAWLRLKLRGYARHLLRTHNGGRVQLDLVRHNLLYPSQSRRGDDPNAPELFVPVASVVETAADLETPLPIPAPPTPQAYEALPPGGPS